MLIQSIQLIRAYWALPRTERFALPVVFILMGIGRLVTKVLPFKYWAKHLGDFNGNAPITPLLDPSQPEHLVRLAWMIQTAARFTPWASPCLTQTWVCALLLRHLSVPHAVCLGVSAPSSPSKALEAHAWVVSGQYAVVGGYAFNDFRVVGCWVWWMDDGRSEECSSIHAH